jgi:hypothetical protein
MCDSPAIRPEIADDAPSCAPPLVAHHLRFTFRVDGGLWQSWIDKPTEGFGTYQHQAGPGRRWSRRSGSERRWVSPANRPRLFAVHVAEDCSVLVHPPLPA